MCKEEIEAITAHFGVRAERVSFELTSILGQAIIWGISIQCPSLFVASEVYTALLVEAARSESLPKFVLEYGRESPAPAA